MGSSCGACGGEALLLSPRRLVLHRHHVWGALLLRWSCVHVERPRWGGSCARVAAARRSRLRL